MLTLTRIAVLLVAAVAVGTAVAEPTKLDDNTAAALREALADERAAQDSYTAVIARHGEVRPFANIVRAERRHERALLALFDAYGVEPPAREQPESGDAPDSVRAACLAAVRAERRNVAMYDGFLEFVRQRDIRDTFVRLRDASRDRHIPAFERCAARRRGRNR